MATQIQIRRQYRNRMLLVLIASAFALPLIMAWILVGNWQSDGGANHGELLRPARPIEHFAVTQPDGQALDQDYLRGRWTLVYLNDSVAGCDPSCRRNLYKMRQVRLALGRELGRVQGLLITADAPDGALQEWLAAEHEGMPAGVGDARTRASFTEAYGDSGSIQGWIYLLDPLGNLVLRYGGASDPKDMLADLKRLLKLSKIG